MSGVQSFVATAHRDVPPASSILSEITGSFVLFQMCGRMAVFHILGPRPPLPRLDAWGCPPGHLRHRLSENVQLFRPELYAVQDPPPK